MPEYEPRPETAGGDMTEPLPPPPPDAIPGEPPAARAPISKRSIALATLLSVLILAGFVAFLALRDDDVADGEQARVPVSQAPTTAQRSTELATTPAPSTTTTVSPTTVAPPTVAVRTPPTGIRPTTTTTTTVDPGDRADVQMLLLVDALQTGSDSELITSFVALVEPYPLDRVDVLSARLEETTPISAYIVVDATSGYSTPEFQQEVTIEALGLLAEIWTLEPFTTVETLLVGLDYTVDGQRFVVPHDVMRAVAERRVSPRDALGV